MKNKVDYNKKFKEDKKKMDTNFDEFVDELDRDVNDFNIQAAFDEATEEIENEENKSEMAVVNIPDTATLCLRQTPDTDRDPIKKLKSGEALEVYSDKDSDWLYVCTESGAEGYVMSKYVKFV